MIKISETTLLTSLIYGLVIGCMIFDVGAAGNEKINTLWANLIDKYSTNILYLISILLMKGLAEVGILFASYTYPYHHLALLLLIFALAGKQACYLFGFFQVALDRFKQWGHK